MLSLILISIAAIFKALMDKSAIDAVSNPWWNKSQSWKNKWAIGLPLQEKKLWYYLWLWTPKYKERFVYSSTILVFITDGWHLAQFFFLGCMFSGMVLYNPLILAANEFWITALGNYFFFSTIFKVIFQTVYQFIRF